MQMKRNDQNKLRIITEVTIRKFQFNLAFYIALFLDSLPTYQGTRKNINVNIVRGVDPDTALQLLLGVGRAAILPVLNISQPVRVTSQPLTGTSELSPPYTPQK